MDLNCRDVFYSEEYYDFLAEDSGDGEATRQELETNCVYPINYRFVAAYLKQKPFRPIPYESFPFALIPKCYGLMGEEALLEMGVLQVQSSPLNLTGSGVLIGFIDTGIDYHNPIFQYEDGSSKIVSIWDQSLPSEHPPEGFYYGTEYEKEQIEEALRSDDPASIVPTIDETGHGTFLAGMAAGRKVAKEKFSGAAPDAQIAVVKLKQAKRNLRNYYMVPDEKQAFSEVDIIEGISYLLKVARKELKPMVICLGIGTSQGAHTGTGFLNDYLNYIATRRGVVVVAAAGNEGNKGHHYHGNIVNNTLAAELKVGEGEKGFSMELWGKAPNRFQIRIESPSGQTTEWIDAGIRGSRSFQFLFEKTQVYVDYLVVDPYSGDQGIFFRFDAPSEGIWKIVVSESRDGEKEFDLWLPIADFISDETFFLLDDPFTTITSPGNASNVITVTAYDQSTGSLFIESSRGYTKNQIIKPDFAAPGVKVLGPGKGDSFVRKSGTSISAALVAGTAACFMQWAIVEKNDYVVSTIGIKNYFIRGAVRNNNLSYPNRDWGYGKINLIDVFLEIR